MSEVYLAHHGILGQKWGVRRYQNPDGSLTSAGQKRYDKLEKKYNRALTKSQIQNARIMAARTKNRIKRENQIAQLEAKRDSDPSKADKLNKKIEKKQKTLGYFNEYTKDMKNAMYRYDKVIEDYKKVKLSSITDENAASTDAAKSVISKYRAQVFSDIINGSNVYTKMQYSIDSLNARSSKEYQKY